MADLGELTERFDEAHAERERAEEELRSASTTAEHYTALLALQRAESARCRALHALTAAKINDEADQMRRWCVHAHRDATCDRDSFLCLDAPSSESAAREAVTCYWSDPATRREDLFDCAAAAEPTIAVVVYELPPPGVLDGPRAEEWLGTVTLQTSADPDGDEVSISVARK